MDKTPRTSFYPCAHSFTCQALLRAWSSCAADPFAYLPELTGTKESKQTTLSRHVCPWGRVIAHFHLPFPNKKYPPVAVVESCGMWLTLRGASRVKFVSRRLSEGEGISGLRRWVGFVGRQKTLALARDKPLSCCLSLHVPSQ